MWKYPGGVYLGVPWPLVGCMAPLGGRMWGGVPQPLLGGVSRLRGESGGRGRAHLQTEPVLELLQVHPVVQGGDVVALLLGGRGLQQGGWSQGPAWPAGPPALPRPGHGLTLASCVSSSSTWAMSSCTRSLFSGRFKSTRSIVATDTMNCR